MAGWKRFQGGIAAAIGVDICAGNRDQVSPLNRKILAVAYVGSNAVGLGTVELNVGPIFVSELDVTTAAAAMNKNVDVLPMDLNVPANTMIHAYITVAGAANVTNLWVLFA